MSDSLLPLNATQEERDIELSAARIGDVPVEIGPLWNVDTCPSDLLPWLAWALSVDEWESCWGEDQKRQMIKQSAILHLKKGTVGAIKRALEAVDAKTEIIEWFEPDSGLAPHTFQLMSWANANLAPHSEMVLGPDLYSSLKRLIDNAKPVRSHYEIRVGAAFGDGLSVYNIMNAAQSLRREARTRQTPLESRCRLSTAAWLQSTEVAREQMTPKAVTDFGNAGMTMVAAIRTVTLTQATMEAA